MVILITVTQSCISLHYPIRINNNKYTKVINPSLHTLKIVFFLFISQGLYGMTETTASVFQSVSNDTIDVVAETVGYIQDHVEVKVNFKLLIYLFP